MVRAAVAIELSRDEECELRALLRQPSVSQQQAFRARIVLRASEGATNTKVAAEAGVSLPTLGRGGAVSVSGAWSCAAVRLAADGR